MKLCKRLLAAFLMLVLSVSVFVIPASAAGWKYDRAYQQYKGKTYTVFGDSAVPEHGIGLSFVLLICAVVLPAGGTRRDHEDRDRKHQHQKRCQEPFT